jgi:hypothetical protein
LQEKWDKSQLICDVNDMLPLLMAKLNLKITALSIANKYCSAHFSNQGFSEVYYNYCDPLLDTAQEHEYDLFSLQDIDVPWKKDDLRDKAEGRDAVFAVFKVTNRKSQTIYNPFW